jgi:hypothetical protein
MKQPPYSLRSHRVGFAQPTRSAGAAHCAAKPFGTRTGFAQPIRSAGAAHAPRIPGITPRRGGGQFLRNGRAELT